jgi:hypothetical protein
MMHPVFLAIAISIFAALSFTGGFAISDWSSANKLQMCEKKLSSKSSNASISPELTHGGYGYIDPLWDWPLYKGKDLSKVIVEVEKENARKFISDRPERVQMIELFYRKINN